MKNVPGCKELMQLHVLYPDCIEVTINPYLATVFFFLLFTPAAYIYMHFRLDFIMEANNMNPDQTAPWEQSDLGPYCLQYKLPIIKEHL